MKRAALTFLAFLSLAGCAKLQYVDELLTLKAVSDEQNQIAEEIEAADEKFKLLLFQIKANQLQQYPDTASFLKNFGKPILVKTVIEGEEKRQLWLYRYATRYFDSEKVYLYFDQHDQLTKWEYVPLAETKGVR